LYCTINDIKDFIDVNIIIELAGDSKRETEDIDLTWPPVDSEAPLDPILINVNKAIKAADEEIDTGLGSRYITPFNPIPDRVNTFSTELAIYQLFLRRRRQNLDESLVTRYKQIKEEIKKLGEGYGKLEGAKLVNDTSAAASGTGEYRGNKTANDKIFTKNLLKKYQ
jgi:phage gp36-like protein